MSKRELDGGRDLKTLKAPKHESEIAIDSELLNQQQSDKSGKLHHGNDTTEAEHAAVAAAAAVAATQAEHNDQHHHQQEQQHNQQQLQQQIYQNAFRQQAEQAAQHHQDDSVDNSGAGSPSAFTSSLGKPTHGSEEWHKQRRENHKEVEKRRRESINTGIKELAALIPTSETNKSQILQRAVSFIKRLKENEANNIEKWTLEKLITEQAVNELNNSNDKLKQELERAYREIEHWKRLAEEKEDKK